MKPSQNPWFRWIALPIACGWFGLLCAAPFAMLGEVWPITGCSLGIVLGMFLAWRNPAKQLSEDIAPESPRPFKLTRPAQAVLVVIALSLASAVLFAARFDNSDKGAFFLISMLVMISTSRRVLRGALDVPGSVAGMLLCGIMLTALVRSVLGKATSSPGMVLAWAGLMVGFEAADEWRALQRAERRRNSRK